MNRAKEFFWLTVSVLIMVVGTYFFKFPNNFSFGGVTGLAVVVAKSGVASAGDINFVINIVLLVFGFIFLGKGFGVKTVYTTLLMSFLLSLMERIWPMDGPLTDETLVELCFAIGTQAVGAAILFNIGASSGGTDIIALIIKKFSRIDVSSALFASDVVVTISAFAVFGIKTGLVSTLGLFVKSLMVDRVIASLNRNKYFNVICEDHEPISDYIVHTLNRSATVWKAQGVYSHKDKYIIFTVMNPREGARLQEFIRKETPEAFMMISNSSEIVGKGFHAFL